MKTILLLSLLCGAAAAQFPIVPGVLNGHGGLSLPVGWTYQQEISSFDLNSCTVGSSSCTTPTLPTVAGSVWVVLAAAANSITISSASAGGTSFTLCPGSVCNAFQSGNAGLDMAYATTGSAGTTSVTVNLSGTTSGYFVVQFWEILPPPGYSGAYDGGATAVSASCTSCVAAAPTVSKTDAVIHAISAGNSPNNTGNLGTVFNAWTAPYIEDYLGGALAFNVSSTTAPTFTQPASPNTPNFIDGAIAFRSTAGVFAVPASPVFSLVQAPANTSFFCSLVCASITVPSTGSGNMLFLMFTSPTTSASGYIGSVSGGGTWVVPTACQAFNAAAGSISCAYVLSSSSGVTSITPTATANGTYFWDYIEVSRSSGSFVLDADSSTFNNSATDNQPGQALILSGTNDVCIQGVESLTGLPFAQTLYYLPAFGGGGNNNVATFGSFGLLLNTINGSAPTWHNTVSEKSVVFGTCFK